jgi:hypothetical protein
MPAKMIASALEQSANIRVIGSFLPNPVVLNRLNGGPCKVNKQLTGFIR